MELRHIRYFLAVAEEGNFTRAAVRLGIGQPPLSQQIRDLEAEIGAVLFHRVPHGAELTAAGKAFLGGVGAIPSRVGAAAEQARRAARGETGLLRVGYTGTAAYNRAFAATIRAFRRAYPEVELTLVEGNSTGLAAAVREGSIDAAFLRPSALDLAELQVHDVGDETMVAALPANHPRLTGGNGCSIALASLKEETFLLTPRGVGPHVFDAVVEACRQVGFSPAIGQAAPQMTSLLSLVAAELGVSIVLASLRQFAIPGVVYRDLDDVRPVVRLALVHAKAMPVLVRNFVAKRGG